MEQTVLNQCGLTCDLKWGEIHLTFIKNSALFYQWRISPFMIGPPILVGAPTFLLHIYYRYFLYTYIRRWRRSLRTHAVKATDQNNSAGSASHGKGMCLFINHQHVHSSTTAPTSVCASLDMFISIRAALWLPRNVH